MVIPDTGPYSVTLDYAEPVGSLTLGGSEYEQTLVVWGTLDLSSASTINLNAKLVLEGGTLSGSGDLTLVGEFIWTGGTMSGSGITTINGTMTWSDHAAGIGSTLDGRTIENHGTVTWPLCTYCFTSMKNGAVFNNRADGTFDAQSEYGPLFAS